MNQSNASDGKALSHPTFSAPSARDISRRKSGQKFIFERTTTRNKKGRLFYSRPFENLRSKFGESNGKALSHPTFSAPSARDVSRRKSGQKFIFERTTTRNKKGRLFYSRPFENLRSKFGASDGNRTHVGSLEGFCTTIVLHSLILNIQQIFTEIIYTFPHYCQRHNYYLGGITFPAGILRVL